ncbi:hypothetical protein SPHINGOT1_400001 [Sphingomonas sp. T1]|nr:hypothetical protein SPHINGOT1_400001 [Sphingomonas sp. T1]
MYRPIGCLLPERLVVPSTLTRVVRRIYASGEGRSFGLYPLMHNL